MSEAETDRKRRGVIKTKLQRLRAAVPVEVMGNKVSQANILQRAADFSQQEEQKDRELDSEIVMLVSRIEQRKEQISQHQRQIPENGISAACFSSGVVEQEYRAFVEDRARVNPEMGIYSSLLDPLFLSFNSMVDNTSLDSFCRSAHRWFAENCSLSKIRQLATALITDPNLEFGPELPAGSTAVAGHIEGGGNNFSQSGGQQ